MLQIVVPMAGRGSRFANAGFELPKPLIEVVDMPMIQLVVRNLRPSAPHRFIFLCLQEHLDKYPMASLLTEVAPGCIIVPVNGVTQGAACTVLLASDYIDSSDPLMIANSDQWVDVAIDDYLHAFEDPTVHGLIMTMTADDPKWSFVRLDERDQVIEVVEKQVVSNEATVGIYNFRHGNEFVAAAKEMIEMELRVNNEFYVAPCYNHLIESGKKVAFVNIGREGDGMYGLGIPDDLALFVGNPIVGRALTAARTTFCSQRAA